ncbi:TPA: hypothetical protein HA244_06145 [Candidatus Micrarchaeota archaeon]|nr:hypothetical protein [Candidatus Micrarchaeota archaeon]
MGKFVIRNYVNMTRPERVQAVRLLSYEHVSPNPDSEPVRPVEHGDFIVTLMKGDKVVAAIVTDGKTKVHNWAGHLDREFLKQYGHTAAEELLRQHLVRIKGKHMTYEGGMYEPAAIAFDKRLKAKGTPVPEVRENTETRTLRIPFNLRRKLKPALPYREKIWKPFDLGRHRTFFEPHH